MSQGIAERVLNHEYKSWLTKLLLHWFKFVLLVDSTTNTQYSIR